MFAMVDQRDRDFDAIAGGHPQVFALVAARIQPLYLLLFDHSSFAGIHIQFKQRIRRSHGGIAVAQSRRFGLRIIGKPGDIGRIVKSDPHHLPGLAVNLPQTGQATLTLFHNQPVGKQGKSFEHHVVTRRDQRGPLFFITQHGTVEAEILPLPVGTKIESVLIVIKTVFMIFTPWQKADRLGVWQFGVEQQHFAGGGAGEINYHELLGGGFMHADVEGLIFFLVDQRVALRRCPDGVAPDLIREQRGGMFTHIPNKA